MSQTPYETNDYSAPNDTQAMYMGGQPGFGQQPVAPDAEQKHKRSQVILLATAVVYLLVQVLSYVLTPATSALGSIYISIIVVALCVLWLVLAIVWIVAVSNKSVASILR